MPVTPRLLCLAAASSFAFVLHGAEPSALTATSPFAPPAGAVAPAAPASEPYEFAAVTVIGDKTSINIYDKGAKKGRWIGVGETADAISVVSYDPRSEQVLVRINGAEKTLTLRKSAIAAGGPIVVGQAGVAAARPVPNYAVNPKTGTYEVTGFSVNGQPAPAPAAAVPVAEPAPVPPTAPVPSSDPAAATGQATPPKQVEYAKPGTTAYEEQEARMLVSDLLEIGIAQRRAYEAAQRKAQEEAAANHPSGQPVAPTAK